MEKKRLRGGRVIHKERPVRVVTLILKGYRKGSVRVWKT